MLLLALLALSSSPAEAAPTERGVRVMAFNVFFESKDIEKSLDVIEAEAPEIVCLRELTPAFATAFKKRFSATYPHMHLRSKQGTWGAGIASVFPLSSVKVFPQEPHRIPAIEARARIDDVTVQIACLHLFPPVGKHRASDGFFETMRKNAVLRKNQAAFLVKRYSTWKGPLLVLGDMNEGPDADAIKTFQAHGLQRACDTAPSASCGATFPGPALFGPAVFEIDHILGRGMTFPSAKTVRGGGSDHFPVVATLVLRGG